MNSVLERKNPAQVTCSHMATISTSAAITTRCLTSPKSVMPVISSLYEDLKNPACLNRMDKNENIELINDDGSGAASTQYLWRFSEYHGKLLIGTFDIATLASGFTQLTDGSLLEMTPEEFSQKMTYVKELLQSLKKTPSGAALTAEEGTTEEAATEDTAEDTQENIQENTEADNTADQAATEAAKTRKQL